MPSDGPYRSTRIAPLDHYRSGGDTCLNCTLDLTVHLGDLRCPEPWDPQRWCACATLGQCQHDYCRHCGARTNAGLHVIDDSPANERCGVPLNLLRVGASDRCPKAECGVPFSAHSLEAVMQHSGTDRLWEIVSAS